MMSLLEMSPDIAEILIILIPMVTIITSYLLIRLSEWREDSKLSYIASKITTPPKTSVSDEVTNEALSKDDWKQLHTRKIILMLAMTYLCIILFLISNMIGSFYYVMGDVTNDVNQTGTDATRIIATVVIEDLFRGGWIGSLPWYGYMPFPLSGSEIYHETWSWIFFTSIITDNPSFFNTFASSVMQFSLLMGLLFLIPLISRSIRQAFLPSLFLFTTGMATMTRGIFNCFAQAWRIAYLDETIQFGLLELGGSHEFGVPTIAIMSALLPYMIAFSLLFVIIGYKLSKGYYPNNKRFTYMFVLYVILSYWAGLFVVMW